MQTNNIFVFKEVMDRNLIEDFWKKQNCQEGTCSCMVAPHRDGDTFRPFYATWN